MMARRGEAVWLAPHTMSRNTASAPLYALPKGAPRRTDCAIPARAAGCLPMAAAPPPPANSGALGERDLFRGSLGAPPEPCRFTMPSADRRRRGKATPKCMPPPKACFTTKLSLQPRTARARAGSGGQRHDG